MKKKSKIATSEHKKINKASFLYKIDRNGYSTELKNTEIRALVCSALIIFCGNPSLIDT